eukprot:gb/GECG01000003.1/.p1 GENE.gb/GECG01000003.1/~~gb/GECG01000003.1/.p1  ORF type:complete len:182 (+),score=10.88 gb/GECG01000003.1/:1-546(+)
MYASETAFALSCLGLLVVLTGFHALQSGMSSRGYVPAQEDSRQRAAPSYPLFNSGNASSECIRLNASFFNRSHPRPIDIKEHPLPRMKIIYIHIGKCGGTSLDANFRRLSRKHKQLSYERVHLRIPHVRKDCYYVTWIRNPFSQFVSAFNFLHGIATFNTTQVTEKKFEYEEGTWVHARAS